VKTLPNTILLSKDDRFSRLAADIAGALLGERLTCYSGRVGDVFPVEAAQCKDAVILSFLSPWIVPKSVLTQVQVALNWHPASRDYPGIGCYNFALYEDALEYGAVCHEMLAKVDTGSIVEERRFPVLASDSVETLKLRTMVTMLSMFHDAVGLFAKGEVPSPCGLSWSRPPFKREQLEALTIIEPTMTPEEVRRRIRATTYPGYPGPRLEIAGETFLFPTPNRPPLA
jgi:methionyl-tRNA formyltransferase